MKLSFSLNCLKCCYFYTQREKLIKKLKIYESSDTYICIWNVPSLTQIVVASNKLSRYSLGLVENYPLRGDDLNLMTFNLFIVLDRCWFLQKMEKDEFRVLTKHYFLNKSYPTSVPSIIVVKCWFPNIKRRCTNTINAERSSFYSEATTSENIKKHLGMKKLNSR